MSGGHFNYDQYKIGQIADQVEQLIISNGKISTDNYGFTTGYTFSEETIAEFKKGLYNLRQAQVYAQRIDYLVSADDGEESFHARLKNDLSGVAMDNEDLTNQEDDNIFELQQEINRLRGQVTYLQEELSSTEDDAAKAADRYERTIADLEEQLGDALYGNR